MADAALPPARRLVQRVPHPQVLVPIGGATVVAVLLGVRAGGVVPAVAALANLIVLALAVLRIRPWWSAPALLVSAYTTLVGIGGLLVGNSLGERGSGAVTETLDAAQASSTFVLFMLASALIALPSLVVANQLGRAPSRTTGRGADRPSRALPVQHDRWLVAGAGAVTVCAVLVLGPVWLVVRGTRFGEASSGTNAVSILLLGLCVLLGAPLSRGRSTLRIWTVVVLTVIAAVFFSSASRYLCLIPPALVAGAVVLGGLRRRLLPTTVAAGAAALLLLPVPLFLRGSPIGHGLAPYAVWMTSFRLNASSLGEYLNNVLISFRITGATAFTEPPIPLRALGISLAPGTGDSVGWYEIAPRLRLNEYSPYSGLGELGNYGWFAAAGVLILIGAVMALLAVASRVLNRSLPGRLLTTAVLATHLLFAAQLSQYNLRSDIRLLYYCLVAELAVLAAMLFVSVVRRSGRGRHTA